MNGTFVLADVTPNPLDPADFGTGSGAKLQARSVAQGLTEFARPEDGVWDRHDPRVLLRHDWRRHRRYGSGEFVEGGQLYLIASPKR